MADKLALYFGYGDGGHFLRGPQRDSLRPQRDYPTFPWDIGLLDTGLLENRKVPDRPDGRVHWVCGGLEIWYGFFWWDRSGDRRGNSNSGFYVRGFGPTPGDPDFGEKTVRAAVRPAFDFACAQWPEVVARQLHPLVLVEDRPF